jgi:hypothetical protein
MCSRRAMDSEWEVPLEQEKKMKKKNRCANLVLFSRYASFGIPHKGTEITQLYQKW